MKKLLLYGAMMLASFCNLIAEDINYVYQNFENETFFSQLSGSGYILDRSNFHTGNWGVFTKTGAITISTENAVSGTHSAKITRMDKSVGQAPLVVHTIKEPIKAPCVFETSLNRQDKAAFTIGIGGTSKGNAMGILCDYTGRIHLYDLDAKRYHATKFFLPADEWCKLRYNIGTENSEIVLVVGGSETVIGTVPTGVVATEGVKKAEFIASVSDVGKATFVDDVVIAPEGISFDFNRVNVISSLNGGRAELIDKKKVKTDASKAIDGNINDNSGVGVVGMPAVLEITLSEPAIVNLVRIYTGDIKNTANPSGETGLKSYKVEILSNGYYHVVGEGKNQPNYLKSGVDSGDNYYFIHAFPAAKAEALRITITESNDTGRRADASKFIAPADRYAYIREVELFSADSKLTGTKLITSLLQGDFPLPIFREENVAEISLKMVDQVADFNAEYELTDYKSGKLIKKGSAVIKKGDNKFSFDITDFADGRYLFNLKSIDKNIEIKGELKRLLRVNRNQKAAPPAGVVEVTNTKIFPVDNFHFEKRSDVSTESTVAKTYQATQSLAPERGVQTARGSAALNIREDGTFVIHFTDATRSGKDRKTHFASSKDLVNWTISDKAPDGIPNKRVSAPFAPLNPAAVPKWGIKTPLDKATLRFYEESDGKVPLNEVRVHWFPPSRGDITKYGMKTWSFYPIWEKNPGEWIVLTKEPLLIDKFSYAGEELEEVYDGNDNFAPQYLSEDGTTLFACKAAKIRRFKPYTVEYDNLPEINRIMRIFYTTDGLNWKIHHLTVPNLNDHWSYQHYGAFYHRIDKNFFLGYIWVYHCSNQQIYPEVIFSRNGLNWHRLENPKPFIENGEPGNWLFGMNFLEATPVPYKGKYYFTLGSAHRRQHFYNTYHEDISHITPTMLKRSFSGRNLPEEWKFFKQIGGWEGLAKGMHESNACVGLAEIREDGWIAVTAKKDNAELISRPFKAINNQLVLNGKGNFKIALTDENGNNLNGYEAEFSGDDTQKIIVWQNGSANLPSEAFKVKINMTKGSEIYTLNFK